MKQSFSLQVGNLAAGLCCRVGTSPGARREEEEVLMMPLMIAMVLLMLLMNNDVELYLRRVGCPQQWTALA